MPKAKTYTNIPATFASVNFCGYYFDNKDRPFRFNVFAGAENLCLHGGMCREEAMQTALGILTLAAFLNKGLTDKERDRLREIAAMEPMAGRPAERVAC